MFKIFLLVILVSTCSADFTEHKHKYEQNSFWYKQILGSNEPLNDLTLLHLLSLRLLIDLRLNDELQIHRDSDFIYELIEGDKYLTEEFLRRYK